MKPCGHDSFPIYRSLIGPLRERARELGYALAIHGTLRRDIDLIACPWADQAEPAPVLAEALRIVIASVHGYAENHDGRNADNRAFFNDGCPGLKAHGRLAWVFHLFPEARGSSHPYVDLSVMPRLADMDARPSFQFRDDPPCVIL